MKLGKYIIFEKQPIIRNLSEQKTNKAPSISEAAIKIEQQLFRQRSDFTTYKNAVNWAESLINPNRTQLLMLYNNTVIDAHLSACVMQRKNLTLSKRFCVVGPDGTENEEKTATLNKKWFYDFLCYSLDSMFWGYSLISFGDYLRKERSFKCVSLVPRQYVKPEYHIVTPDTGSISGTDYLEGIWPDWTIGVGECRDLGILMKATPLVMWKTGAMGSWAEFQEIFGSPVRIGSTESKDPRTLDSFVDKLRNFGAAQWILLTGREKIEFKESSRQDAHKVFDEMANRINSEISKLILGQTGTTDEKAHVGSSEVHERILEQIGEQDEIFIEGVLNNQLLPLLITHGVLNEGDRIEADDSEDLTFDQILKSDAELMKWYDISPEQIKETYGREVTPKAVVDTGLGNFQDKLKNYYGL